MDNAAARPIMRPESYIDQALCLETLENKAGILVQRLEQVLFHAGADRDDGAKSPNGEPPRPDATARRVMEAISGLDSRLEAPDEQIFRLARVVCPGPKPASPNTPSGYTGAGPGPR